ncbi:2-oxoacid:acceptor oxidoreductase family protein [Uliginosibacterium gangwonense]|uniref:2-oxoacid:acceptor oxidoreductase family protein n=1 Tax=Uliginosibacterium gangwonense TaxID=392736 RepID=UPI000375D938|nr:2-oxoacid:acceptor oxidoreductase family protein [Uliginosibacterium gangwonense]
MASDTLGLHETVWLGRGGQGAFTASRLLGLSAVQFGGQHAIAFPSFGPERRGAPVFAYTRIAPQPIHARSAIRRADALVVLDASLLDQVSTPFVHDGTVVIVNTPSQERSPGLRGQIVCVDADTIARKTLGTSHTNTVLLGFLVGLTGWLPAESVAAGIAQEFGQGSKTQKNILAFQHAFALGQQKKQAS